MATSTNIDDTVSSTDTTNDTSAIKRQLIAIDGIGPSKAEELINAGVTKLSDLKRVKYNRMLNTETQLSIKYPTSKDLSWDYVNTIINVLQKNVSKSIIGVGSYRRERAIVSDIDVITTVDLSTIAELIQTIHTRLHPESTFKFLGMYAAGERKCSMIVQFRGKNARVDIFKVLPEERPYALLHYTGPSSFNIRIRAHAKAQGFKLNQFGLYDRENNLIKLNSERAILKYIGVTYKVPSARQ